MADPLVIAAISGAPAAIIFDRAITWLRNRRKDVADAELTTGNAWQTIVTELRDDIKDLRDRVTDLENELTRERDRNKTLENEVDRYKRIARSLARQVLKLRDALSAAKVDLPALPADIEDALTVIDLP